MNAETAPLSSPAARVSRRRARPLLWTAVLLLVIFSAIFHQSFSSRYVAFSNDGPLGQLVAEQNWPSVAKGLWVDLNWLGNEALNPPPGITTGMRYITSPQIYLNILYPAALLIVGVAACYCLRKLKMSFMACILGGLAAGLNSDFFSTCCWGVASQIIGFGANYFAVGLLASGGPRPKVRLMLAGLAVGMGIMEAYDIGALFSLFVAAFVLYQALFLTDEGGISPGKIGKGTLRIAVVAVFAAFISLHSLTSLVGTQIHGVVGTAQDKETKEKHWDIATQWSLPKKEIFQLFVPGVFGYRMESTNGDKYWGDIGRSPTLDGLLKQRTVANPQTRVQIDAQLRTSNLWRFSGTGLYAGILVLVVALWAVLQSFRRDRSPYSRRQRRAIWFWAGVLVVTVLLAFGRFAPFYQLFYALPYVSTIRNPIKFMHVFTWALIILFGYGVDGLYRAYMRDAIVSAVGWRTRFKSWLATASRFEKVWFRGSIGAVIVALLGWMIYSAGNANLAEHIASVGIDPGSAVMDAKFSLHAVGWFILFLVMALALLVFIFSGMFAGPRARWGGLLLGALLVAELVHADAPWPRYWNVAFKYGSNPIVDILKDKPWEHRVAMNGIGRRGDPQFELFQQVYSIEWQQQLFPYYNIQSLEVVMEPRVSVDKDRFLRAIPPTTPSNLKRVWELSNTRYILGIGARVVDYMNQAMDPVERRFRLVKSFNLVPKPGTPGNWVTDYTAVANDHGELGLVEFTGALPRASLFTNWLVNTNDETTLETLADPGFDPHRTVLVATDLPAPSSVSSNAPGSVEITNYRSKHIELSADVKTPSLLLFVDRYSPAWQTEVDGKPAPLLRCDFILRGIYLEPGQHHIVMRYVTSLKTLYVSLAAILFGIVLSGILIFSGSEPDPEPQVGVTTRSDDAGTSTAA